MELENRFQIAYIAIKNMSDLAVIAERPRRVRAALIVITLTAGSGMAFAAPNSSNAPAPAAVTPAGAAPANAVAGPSASNPAPVGPPSGLAKDVVEPDLDVAGNEEIEVHGAAPAGAYFAIDQAQLERAESNDLHKVLSGTPGVYVRDEDGFGLRPNIGMRGAAADRSAKIAFMEDGLLIAPAPYSAPAAYYTPIITRMSRIEVTKGPSAIRFGPNTVGGALNLISEPMPGARMAYLDLAGGTTAFGKLHARAAERGERWGVMAEFVKLRSSGFKQLDGGGNTGFDKNDASILAMYQSKSTAEVFQRWELRAGYSDEVSNETYVGLTNVDFAKTPQRRYRATASDRMDWHHVRLRATHRVEFGTRTRLETAAYRNQFQRAWAKFDGFVGQRDLVNLLARPGALENANYYAVMTGEQSTASADEALIVGTNDRYFASQGIQSTLTMERQTGSVAHQVDAGIRIHYDSANRRRWEDAFDLVAGQIVRNQLARDQVSNSRAVTWAAALHVQDKARWRKLEVTGGVRVELIAYHFYDYLAAALREGQYGVVIPGVGLEYHVTDKLSAIAGVHRGFVPVAASAGSGVKPELSVNYEAGARLRTAWLTGDVIGFFSNYSNLKASCTQSSGCDEVREGDEFNGGRVRIWGLEAHVEGDVPVSRRLHISAPVAAAYTLTQSSFQTAFTSGFEGWGRVQVGDELPYLPAHQVSLSAALKHRRVELGASARYVSAMRDLPGQGQLDPTQGAQALLTVDATAHVTLSRLAEIYGTVSNALDEQAIISRRPYGARPNAPRLVTVGYKARF